VLRDGLRIALAPGQGPAEGPGHDRAREGRPLAHEPGPRRDDFHLGAVLLEERQGQPVEREKPPRLLGDRARDVLHGEAQVDRVRDLVDRGQTLGLRLHVLLAVAEALLDGAQVRARGAAQEAAEEEGHGVQRAQRLLGRHQGEDGDDRRVEESDGERVREPGAHADAHHVRVEQEPHRALQPSRDRGSEAHAERVHQVLGDLEPPVPVPHPLRDEDGDGEGTVDGDHEDGGQGTGARVVPDEGQREQAERHGEPARQGADVLPPAVQVGVEDLEGAALHAAPSSSNGVQVEHGKGRPAKPGAPARPEQDRREARFTRAERRGVQGGRLVAPLARYTIGA
jgi:hypothetical protein